MTSKRISIDDAFGILLLSSQPHAAVERLLAALRDYTCRLWCNGVLLDPNYIRAELTLRARTEADGRRRIDVVPARGWVEQSYHWELLRADLDKLRRPAAPPQRRRGAVVKHDWFAICGEIARRCIDPATGRVAVPKSERKLAGDVLEWYQRTHDEEPAESELREAVKVICAALRKAPN